MAHDPDAFPLTVRQYDEQMTAAQFDLRVLLRKAHNLVDHERRGVALKSDTELELEELEQQIAERELRRRAQAGDSDALSALALQAAELEILAGRADANCAAQEAAINAGSRPRDDARVRPPPVTSHR